MYMVKIKVTWQIITTTGTMCQEYTKARSALAVPLGFPSDTCVTHILTSAILWLMSSQCHSLVNVREALLDHPI